jgi:diketogulonate reductase-like aldo/keto reductase
MLRWILQRGLIVVAKTASIASRMSENRLVLNFFRIEDEMMQLSILATPE